MLKILLVDDSNDKVVNIIKTIREVSEKIIVEIVTDFISAQKQLISFRYDLLILDIHIPIREGEQPNTDNGKNLLNEINRKTSINSPYYIISLTQYHDECFNLSDVWQTVNYIPESIDWKYPLVNLIKHIIKCNISNNDSSPSKPTIFLEGKTDEKILTEAIRLFKPELLSRITIRSEKSAGASWVARQIIVWSHTLIREDSKYVKCIGLLDGDYAGKQAQEEINRVIKNDSAQSQTFRLFKLSTNYARHIISIKQKGLDLPVTLEEMFEHEIWEYAQKQSWIEKRTNPENLLTNPDKWNKFETSLKDYIQSLNLDDKEILYLSCVKDDCKALFANYILSLPESEKTKALNCFGKLIEEINEYLIK